LLHRGVPLGGGWTAEAGYIVCFFVMSPCALFGVLLQLVTRRPTPPRNYAAPQTVSTLDDQMTTQWWTEEYQLSADHYANFIVALVDALELENPIFMGSSFGGNIALQLALRRPDRFAGVIPVEGADYSPGFYLDWWQHPRANAAQVCASGVWDLMAPQSPEADRWKTWFYYSQGSEAF
jgi:pimeloyl-ACP methyl ester carboxylesterase